MNEKMIQIAIDFLGVSMDEIEKYSMPLPEINAYLFCKPGRGGSKIIINVDGEKFTTGSAINLDDMVSDFRAGKRN